MEARAESQPICFHSYSKKAIQALLRMVETLPGLELKAFPLQVALLSNIAMLLIRGYLTRMGLAPQERQRAS